MLLTACQGAFTDGGENTPSTGSRPQFVGRERELSELRSGLADATSGRGRLVDNSLSGEPGIGKTRLAEELAADAASRGMRVVWGRCWEGGGAPAYLPWVDVLRTLIFNESRDRERHSALPAEIAQLIPELSSETDDASSSCRSSSGALSAVRRGCDPAETVGAFSSAAGDY